MFSRMRPFHFGLWKISTASLQVAVVPQVTVRTTVNGREETLSEYLCDWPDCPNVATQAIGVMRELRAHVAMCAEHAARLSTRDDTKSRP